MAIEEQDSDSQSQETTTQTTETEVASPVVSDKPLTGDELKAGMLAEINKGLGEVKEKSALDEPENKEIEIKPAKEAKTDKEKKPEEKDDLYKMPDGLQKDSRARFQKLVDTAKQEKERANQLLESGTRVLL